MEKDEPQYHQQCCDQYVGKLFSSPFNPTVYVIDRIILAQDSVAVYYTEAENIHRQIVISAIWLLNSSKCREIIWI